MQHQHFNPAFARQVCACFEHDFLYAYIIRIASIINQMKLRSKHLL